jgi:3D-(3,5/4)-trihydroxycyclohexane-1,2-dione acylhydrolase (decyclizing)
MVGDGSYLMLSSELVTAVAERQKLTIVLVDNRGYKSIGNLSRSLGMDGFGTLYRYRSNGSRGVDSEGSTDYLPVDLAANAESLGAKAIRAPSVDELRAALEAAKAEQGPVVIVVEVDRYVDVPGYESWWDVAVAEVSEVESVRAAREQYEAARGDERSHV